MVYEPLTVHMTDNNTDSSTSPTGQTEIINVTPRTPLISESDKKTCWVCFACEEDDLTALWVEPCHCRGTTRWVHQICLQRWIDEKQHGNSAASVSCPQCNTKYIIVFPSTGPVMVVLDVIDGVINRLCPFVAAGLIVGSVYWTAVTYGAVTVMQVMGQKDGLLVMEEADSLFLIVGLPTIPIVLILAKMVRWEEAVTRCIRQNVYSIPLLRYILPAFGQTNEAIRTPSEPAPLSDAISATRVICGALLLPTVAQAVGHMLFDHIESNLQRTMFGALAFVGIKGAIKIYYRQQQWVRQAKRTILDCTEDKDDIESQSQGSSTDEVEDN